MVLRFPVLVTCLLGSVVCIASLQAQETRLRLTPTTRIATPAGAAASPAADVATGSGGEVFVLFPQPGVVRVLGPEGRPRREIRGQQGRAGPAGASRLHVFRDTLVIGSGGRLALYETGGRYLRTVAFSAAVGGRGMDPAPPFALLADGTVLSVPRLVAAAQAAGRVRAVPLLRTGRQGTILDTIGWQSVRNGILAVRDPVDATRQIFSQQPWRDDDLLAVSPDGRWIAVVTREASRERGSAAFRVTRLSPGGDTLSSRLVSYPPVALDDAAVERKLARFAENPGFVVGGRFIEAAVREAMYVPRFHPPVTRAVAGSDGTLWLRREEPSGGTVRWDVLDPRNRKVGEFFTDAGFRLLEVQADAVWGIPDEGAELTRFRVQRGEG